MKALIVGGNGFIGSHLSDLLLEMGWNVRVYDRVEELFRPFNSRIEYVRGELDNRKLLEQALQGIDVAFHLASSTIPKTSNDDPAADVQSNLIATLGFLQGCVNKRVVKVVFLSTGGAIYGFPERLPISESHPINPVVSYAIVKLAIEKYLYLFNKLYNLEYIVLRPSNPYGPRQNPLSGQGLITTFLWRALNQQPLRVWGDGSVGRDYFFVTDLAHACLKAALYEGNYRVFNIGSSCSLTINQIIEVISNICKRKLDVIYDPSRAFDAPQITLDIKQAKEHLGWCPFSAFSARSVFDLAVVTNHTIKATEWRIISLRSLGINRLIKSRYPRRFKNKSFRGLNNEAIKS